jgi:predicted permease
MWWRSKRREADLKDELRTHLEMAAADRVERGETRDAAKAAARREFGNVALVEDATRRAWGGAWLGVIAQDLRLGWRLLWRTPGTTAVAVLSLALGIGANTAIFSVMDALLWRPLPVTRPGDLVEFQTATPGSPWSGDQWSGLQFPYPTFERYRDSAHAFASIAAIVDLYRSSPLIGNVPVTMDAGAVHVALVSGTYFDTFGVFPAAGRLMGADDDRVPGGHPLAVISERLWARWLSRSPNAVGQVLTLGNLRYTIIGVAASPFTGDMVASPTDIWIPIAMGAQVFADRPSLLTNQNGGWVRIVARLAPGVTPEAASAAVSSVYLSNRGDVPRDPRMTEKEFHDASNARILMRSLARGFSPERAGLTSSLLIAAAIVGLVLLLACSNVANLLLARGSAREHEMAVRRAIGAGTRRLVRQLLTESALLSALGGALACVVAWWGATALAATLGSGLNGVTLDVHADWRVFAAMLALSVFSVVLFGLVPALSGARQGASVIAGPAARATRRRRFATSRGLVIAQIAVSMVLAIGALLFLRTLQNLRSTALTEARQHVVVAWVPVSEQGTRGAAVATLFQDALDRAAAIPGVTSVSASSSSFFGAGGGTGSPVIVPGHLRTDSEDFFVRWNLISPGFFDTVGIRLIAGRDFDSRDRDGASRVAIVNEAMARMYFGTASAVGQHFGMRRDTGTEIEIVGVVADAPIDSPRSAGERMIYLPFRQGQQQLGEMALFVSTAGDSAAMAGSIRAALRSLDATLPVRDISSLSDLLDRSLVRDRVLAGLASAFGLIAATLSCVGLYGLMSYVTARRTREIGVRLALGATPRAMLVLTLREALIVAIAGVAIGIPAVIAASRLIQAELFNVSAADPRMLVVAGLALIAPAAIAAAGPAIRATRVDPTTALRVE